MAVQSQYLPKPLPAYPNYTDLANKEGHDDLGWRHYVVGFTGPRNGMLIMTNSDNGEDMYSTLLEQLSGDTFTPLEWEGFKAPLIETPPSNSRLQP
jgi:hypothetical protein